MKFSDLNIAARSMLNALSASASLRTDELGRCANPRLDPAAAANVLNSMREKGLIYSRQKLANAQYTAWFITDVGRAVFMGRPDGEVLLAAGGVVQPETPAPEKGDQFLITGNHVGYDALVTTADKAVAVAAHRAELSPGKVIQVYKLVAEAHLPKPVKPTAQIILL